MAASGRWWFAVLCIALALAAAGILVRVPVAEEASGITRGSPMDLTAYAAGKPSRGLRLLFVHHSCGGQWLAPVGPNLSRSSIYESAVNGGDLRARLQADGYDVHEASYGSLVGDKTDIFDWPGKFRDHMEQVLTCDRQDAFYADGRRNEVVVFKSCFPNSLFVQRGDPPGDPGGARLTVENAKAAYRLLLPEFAKHPEVLFVAVTAPPVAKRSTPLWNVLAQWVLGRARLSTSGPLAREFNNWLKDPGAGWLAGYTGRNVVVFDLYDVLTGNGASNFSRYATGPDGTDDHPSAEGNRAATEAFLPFLNRAVRRSGIAE